MFHGIKNGWDLIKASIRVFNHHPKLIVPLFLTWLVYASIILYSQYWFNWDAFTGSQILLIIFGIIFIFAFLLAFSCSMLLELIQQLESGAQMNVAKSFGYTMSHNVIRILPLVLVWAVVWFVMFIIQALSSKKNGKGDKESISAENVAKTLAGYQRFSLLRAFFKALEKGVRMIMFLILPAIAWENLSFWQSVKKGIAVFTTHLSEFVTGFVLTGVAAMIIFLPPAILFYISDKTDAAFPDLVWVLTIIYIAFAWSYSIYLEQMFAAELYLWNRKWEKEVAKAQQEGRPIPALREVPIPSMLDEVYELVEESEGRV